MLIYGYPSGNSKDATVRSEGPIEVLRVRFVFIILSCPSLFAVSTMDSAAGLRVQKRRADGEISAVECASRKKRTKGSIAARSAASMPTTGVPQQSRSHSRRPQHATGQRQRQQHPLCGYSTNGAMRNSHASQRSLKMCFEGQSKNATRALFARTVLPTQRTRANGSSVSVTPRGAATAPPAVPPRTVAHPQLRSNLGGAIAVAAAWRASAPFAVPRPGNSRHVGVHSALGAVELTEALAVMRSPELVALGDSQPPVSPCPTQLCTPSVPASSVTPTNSPIAAKAPTPRAGGLVTDTRAAGDNAEHVKSPAGEAWRSYTGRYRAPICRWLLRARRELRLAPVTTHVAVRLLDIVVARMVEVGHASDAASSLSAGVCTARRNNLSMSRVGHTDMTALIMTDGARAAMASASDRRDRSLSREQRRLLSVTVLLLAGKLEEREMRLPMLEDLHGILSPSGSSEQDLESSKAKLRGASLQVLSLLEWRLEPLRTTAMHWLDFVLASGGLFVDDNLQQRGAQKLALTAAHNVMQALKRSRVDRNARRGGSNTYSDSGSDSDLNSDSDSDAAGDNAVSPGGAADITVDVHRPYVPLSSLGTGAGAVLLRCFRRGAVAALDAAVLNVKLGCKSEGCPPDEVLAAAAVAAAREALGLVDSWRRELEELTGVSRSMYADTFAQVKASCGGLEDHCYQLVPFTDRVG